MKNKGFMRGILGLALVFGLVLAGCSTTANIITTDSATLTNVIRVTDNGFRKDAVRVSPDGAKILYSESTKSNVEATMSYADYTIMLLRDANSSVKSPLVTDPSFGPVWFDDSSEYVYVTYEGGTSKLVRSNIVGGGKTYITRDSIGRYDARPSIRGHIILCDTLVDGVQHIVSVRDNGSEVAILGQGHSPSWHPDGTKFVFIRGGSICEMDLKTNQVSQLYAASTAKSVREECSQPSYSRDGKYILFAKGANTFARTEGRKRNCPAHDELAGKRIS